MAQIPGSIRVTGFVHPIDTDDTYNTSATGVSSTTAYYVAIDREVYYIPNMTKEQCLRALDVMKELAEKVWTEMCDQLMARIMETPHDKGVEIDTEQARLRSLSGADMDLKLTYAWGHKHIDIRTRLADVLADEKIEEAKEGKLKVENAVDALACRLALARPRRDLS